MALLVVTTAPSLVGRTAAVLISAGTEARDALVGEAKWPAVPAEATGERRELLEWLHELLAERSPWGSLHEACKETDTGVRGQLQPRLGVNKSTVHRWMHDKKLPTEKAFGEFCEHYNKSVEGLDGYSPIPDDERDRMLALLTVLWRRNSPAQRLQEERARYDDLSHMAAEVQADRDGLLAELADASQRSNRPMPSCAGSTPTPTDSPAKLGRKR